MILKCFVNEIKDHILFILIGFMYLIKILVFFYLIDIKEVKELNSEKF